MKKLIYVLVFVLFAAGVTACGKKEGESSASANTETRQVVKEEGKKETSAAASAAEDSDEYWIYPDAEEIVEVPLGINADGTQKELVGVKLPKNYTMFFLNYDNDGNQQTVAGSSTLDSIIQSGKLNQENVPSMVQMFDSKGDLALTIKEYTDETISKIKNEASDSIDIEAPEGCQCFVIPPNDVIKGVRVYYIYKDQWIFCGRYTGEFQDTKSLEDFGYQVKSLITVK